MNMLIYLGSARAPHDLLSFCAPLVQKLATRLTLLTRGDASAGPLLGQAAARFRMLQGVHLDVRTGRGTPRTVLHQATDEQQYDLVVWGERPGLLLGSHDATLARRLTPSMLFVRGAERSPRRILLASGGDRRTLDHIRYVARLAQSLGATVTLLHVLSQQSLVFKAPSGQDVDPQAFLAAQTREAQILQLAADWLADDGIPAQAKARSGPVIGTIVDELRAGDYDLLVIGDHQADSIYDRFLLRNMTKELLAASPRSVLVVK